MKTRQLVENCNYCGPCPSQETTNDECTVPDEFCDCENYGTWSTWTPADCESLPCGRDDNMQSRTFNVHAGKNLPYGCPTNETRACPMVECPPAEDTVTHDSIEYVLHPLTGGLGYHNEVDCTDISGQYEVVNASVCEQVGAKFKQSLQSLDAGVFWKETEDFINMGVPF